MPQTEPRYNIGDVIIVGEIDENGFLGRNNHPGKEQQGMRGVILSYFMERMDFENLWHYEADDEDIPESADSIHYYGVGLFGNYDNGTTAHRHVAAFNRSGRCEIVNLVEHEIERHDGVTIDHEEARVLDKFTSDADEDGWAKDSFTESEMRAYLNVCEKVESAISS